jgi:hypothetical protein
MRLENGDVDVKVRLRFTEEFLNAKTQGRKGAKGTLQD